MQLTTSVIRVQGLYETSFYFSVFNILIFLLIFVNSFITFIKFIKTSLLPHSTLSPFQTAKIIKQNCFIHTSQYHKTQHQSTKTTFRKKQINILHKLNQNQSFMLLNLFHFHPLAPFFNYKSSPFPLKQLSTFKLELLLILQLKLPSAFPLQYFNILF